MVAMMETRITGACRGRASRLALVALLALATCGAASAAAAAAPARAPARYVIEAGAAASPLERFAANELRAAIRVTLQADAALERAGTPAAAGTCRILVGSARDHAGIAALVRGGFVRPPSRAEGYALRIAPDPDRPNGTLAVVAGADDRGAAYGTMDLVHHHLARLAPGAGAFAVADSPRIARRGLWTWAGRVYDYQRYLDNMARWKLNTLVLWHAYAPENGRAVLGYAARRGIDVVWGYNLAYENPVCPSDTLELRRWREYVVRTFERDYATIGARTVYFQAFTEAQDYVSFCRFGKQCPNGCAGKSGGELVVQWMNPMIRALLERHPDLRIVCGVHASALRSSFSALAGLDARAELMWEDAGDFPFAYEPDKVSPKTFPRTLEWTRELAALRGPGAGASFVFKGLSASYGGLDAMLEPRPLLERLVAQRAPLWRTRERAWRANLGYELQAARVIAAQPRGNSSLVGLVEDGLWEAREWFPVAAFSESAWNPGRTPAEIVGLLDACPAVTKLR
jgi:hypothetical protein